MRLFREKIAFPILLAAAVVAAFGFAATARAQGPGEEGYTGPILEIPVPGVEFSGIIRDRDITVPWLGQYIGGVYAFLVSIAGMFAATVMIFGGFQYTTAAGDKAKIGAAKKRMGNAFIGLILVFGSYVILYSINPSLTTFSGLRIMGVQNVPLEESLAADEEEHVGVVADEQAAAVTPPSGTGSCDSRITAQFTSVKGATGISGNGNINVVTAESYKKVAAALYAATAALPGGPYSIRGTGQRPLGERGDSERCKTVGGVKNREGYCSSGGWSQVFKWETKCLGKKKCSGDPICNPYGWDNISLDANKNIIIDPGACPNADKCPHTTGSAVDIICSSSKYDAWYKSTYGKPPSAGGTFYAPCQLMLEKIMLANGWCRLYSEAWHFEKPVKSGSACSFKIDEILGKQKGGHDYADCKGAYSLSDKTCISIDL